LRVEYEYLQYNRDNGQFYGSMKSGLDGSKMWAQEKLGGIDN
jgi:hypothetical protein